jgi:hypothetical protein
MFMLIYAAAYLALLPFIISGTLFRRYSFWIRSPPRRPSVPLPRPSRRHGDLVAHRPRRPSQMRRQSGVDVDQQPHTRPVLQPGMASARQPGGWSTCGRAIACHTDRVASRGGRSRQGTVEPIWTG